MQRVAIIVPGGIGSGLHAQGVPALSALVADIAEHHEVIVYSLTAADPGFEPRGFYIRCRPEARISRLGILRLITTILIEHARTPFDVFHGFWATPAGTIAVLLGKLLRRPSIVSLQGGEAAAVESINYGNMLRPRTRALTMFTCQHATAMVTLTGFQLVALRAHGLRRSVVSVIPYGADASQFSHPAQPLRAPIRFLHVANLTEVKDQMTLLEVFDRVRQYVDATLDIVGADYLQGSLQGEAARRGLSDNVNFVGFVPHAQLPAYFARAHCLVHTSLYEGQAVVVAEAALSRTLVCGTRTGVLADGPTPGFVTAEVGQANMLAAKIVDVVTNARRYADMIETAYRHAARHDRSWTAAQYDAIYQSL